MVEGGCVVASRGGGEGEAADAAGEGAVVGGAAAGVGERLVGLLHLDEAAGVLLGGVRRGHVRVVLARHPPVRRPHVLEGAPLRRDPQQVVERRLLLLLVRRGRPRGPSGRGGRRPRPRRRAGREGPEPRAAAAAAAGDGTGEGGRGGRCEVGHV